MPRRHQVSSAETKTAALRPPTPGLNVDCVLAALAASATLRLGIDREQAVDVLHVVDVQRAGGLFQQQAVLQVVVARAGVVELRAEQVAAG